MAKPVSSLTAGIAHGDTPPTFPSRADALLEQSRQRRIVVAVGGSGASLDTVRAACSLAERLDASWHAVHVETPESTSGPSSRSRAADGLALAAALGATVATVPAADVAEGLVSQVEDHAATDVVLRWNSPLGMRKWVQAPLAQILANRCGQATIHLLPRAGPPQPAPAGSTYPARPAAHSARAYLLATGFVALTAFVIEPIWYLTGARGVDLLFLLPVIAASVRLGLRPAILAALLSVVCYNFLFLRPLFHFTVNAPQNIVMLTVLLGVALYTGMISERLQRRLRLSDRSAKENAAIATFAQELARASTWEGTAEVVCGSIASMLEVRAALLREQDGALVVVGGAPGHPSFGPVDHVALEWTWQSGEGSGRGTSQMAAADWQFHALTTSLGTLAVLAIARDDGTPPIPADRAVLFATLIGQASLAHERLRLEDQAVANAAARP